jgi:hypothetical protein
MPKQLFSLRAVGAKQIRTNCFASKALIKPSREKEATERLFLQSNGIL